ncbi:glycosyltransferase [Corynebacterium sp. SCR221107]|uniref:glycosyltransferase family 4 protein n=1 Tax=Corynebacterium sp. SCR221107 TaxID=3017361 RepID=UPI0022EC39C0|nr:glycosyltransferase [Corynebacterium sp. SCR221107]WBT08112.1 glycosyltransferase [Corynebacterium sp. SCR221107]
MSSHEGTFAPSDRTLWIHWGRTGGGPRFLLELVEGDLKASPRGTQFISYNPDAEIGDQFQRLAIPRLKIRTYNSKIGVILGLPRLLINSIRMNWWIRKHKIRRVVGVMESVYQSLSVPLFLPRSVEYIAGIHDGKHHPGESSVVQRIGRRLELWRADKVLAFSEEVGRILRAEVPNKQVLVASHPPFGVESELPSPRKFPASRPIIIGLFGRLQEYKGIDVLLEANEILHTKPSFGDLPEISVRIVGNGPGERFRDTAIGRWASWDTRWIPEEEVDGIVADFDIMALPYTEASQSGPVSLALAQAIPCIATPKGALPTQVDGFGIVAKDASPEAVAQAIYDLVTDPSLYERLSQSAVSKLSTTMLWDDLATFIRNGGATSSPAQTSK